jgi:ubiquinone/menaquinone biosynthesis C-methylase UbiE
MSPRHLFRQQLAAYDASPRTGFLYERLKSWETTRADVAYRLLPVGGRLLDVGCGDGSFALRAKGKYREVWATDISARMLSEAARKADIYFVQQDMDEGLPFANSLFDAITCLGVILYLFDLRFAMNELHRVLKPGGSLIVHVVNFVYLPRRIALLLGTWPRTTSQAEWDGQLHYFTMSSLVQLFEQSDFRVVTKTGSGIFANLRNWWPSLLTGDLIVKGIKRG